MNVRLPIALVAIILSVIACGHSDPGENHGNLITKPGGLVITQERHPSGWGRAECFVCHAQKNLHLENENTLPGVDLAAIRAIVERDGEASCSACHGTNGL